MKPGNERTQLSSFSLIVGGGFAIIGLWPLIFRGQCPRGWALGITLVMVLLGLLAPTLLKPIYRMWMALGHALGWINSRIILGTLFYTVFTIGGFLLRLLKVDPMRRQFEPNRASYRVPRSPRPGTHLKRQF
jgi:hypothetical protein